ncbi:hypothetical protein SK128_009549 [Halocaridina rubra]|uniref:Uncharacterized protein n=1 Tax=Halocaridina rubra TaxID=373956 RepID=A0AAN8X704_HALRR
MCVFDYIQSPSPISEILDGRDITSQSRDFIVQAECHRLSLRKRSKQKGSVPRGNNNVITMETHLLFTSSTQNEPSGPPATGPRFVLGALRRPEFDLILNRAQRLSINSYLATTAEEDLQESKTAKSSNYQDGEDDEEEPSKDHTEGGNDISDSITLPKDVSGNTENTQWHNNSASAIYPLEKSVWFAAEDEPPMEEVPRFIPRPYWRNKPPASKPKSSLKS